MADEDACSECFGLNILIIFDPALGTRENLGLPLAFAGRRNSGDRYQFERDFSWGRFEC